MAKKYTSTLQVRCWKEHNCVACGSTYAYILSRKAVGTGPTPERAATHMNKVIGDITRDETDLQPCPTCGLYQPDMIGRRRARQRMIIMVIAVILIGITLIIRASYGLQANVLTWVAGIICGAAALANFALEMQNRNRDLQANQQFAQQQIAAGQVRFKPGQPNARADEFATPSRSMIHLFALLLLALSIVGAFAPEMLRSAKHWPLNEACYPPVVGPTDSTRIYLPEEIHSMKSYWRGWPKATMTYNGQSKDMTASTNQNDWGSTISVKSEEKDTTSRPWVQVTLPDAPEFSGKTVKCDLELTVEFPQIDNSGHQYVEIRRTMAHSLTINLAPTGAGTQYDTYWWGGTAGGGMMIALAGLLLFLQAKGLERKATPTKVFQI